MHRFWGKSKHNVRERACPWPHRIGASTLGLRLKVIRRGARLASETRAQGMGVRQRVEGEEFSRQKVDVACTTPFVLNRPPCQTTPFSAHCWYSDTLLGHITPPGPVKTQTVKMWSKTTGKMFDHAIVGGFGRSALGQLFTKLHVLP